MNIFTTRLATINIEHFLEGYMRSENFSIFFKEGNF